ncbi:hypothetical protein L4D06_19735 [Enterovibrio makurazakiensis]
MSNQHVSVIANMGMPSNIKGVGGGAKLKAKDDLFWGDEALAKMDVECDD